MTDAFLKLRDRMRRQASGEDALQEAFVKLWGRYSPASGKEAEALLNRTMRNTSVDMYRRSRRTVPIESLSGDRAAQEEVGTDTQTRETIFLKVEELVQRDLSDTQQYIIYRHEYEGASLETIARELGMQAPAVRMQLSRARKTIRDRYNEQELL